MDMSASGVPHYYYLSPSVVIDGAFGSSAHKVACNHTPPRMRLPEHTSQLPQASVQRRQSPPGACLVVNQIFW